eukprot:16052237-Heterocapsa_arctica.AAC.1
MEPGQFACELPRSGGQVDWPWWCGSFWPQSLRSLRSTAPVSGPSRVVKRPAEVGVSPLFCPSSGRDWSRTWQELGAQSRE